MGSTHYFVLRQGSGWIFVTVHAVTKDIPPYYQNGTHITKQ